jgi:hypothetical protein
MVPARPFSRTGSRCWLAVILVLAAVFRLPQITAPLADNMQIKQVYVSNKARSIAHPPLNPLRITLDFLDERGNRLALTEEVPVYTGLLGLCYRLLGEHDWLGRILSLLGTLAAIGAYAELTRREHGIEIAGAGTFLLAMAPLLVFYGRAVLPDPWMLAAMLTAALCYRVHLDGNGPGWLIFAACAAALAPLCKYYGVMICVPLAGMTVGSDGPRSRRWLPLLILVTATLLPVGLWMLSVFFRTINPVDSGWSGDGKPMPYLVFQAPRVLLSSAFFGGFLLRFLVRDCGPVTAALGILGVVGAIRNSRIADQGRATLQSLLWWTAMGLIFFLLFAPKLIDHDYYELMLLPAAATWGAIGLRGLVDRVAANRPRRTVAVFGTVAIAAAVQLPLCTSGMFQIDRGKLVLAERLKVWTDAGRRVVVMGPGIELATVIHYCNREGWILPRIQRLPDNWRARLDGFRASGAQAMAIYFEPKATPGARASLEALAEHLPVLERGAGPWSRNGGTCSYWILGLTRDDAGQAPSDHLARRHSEPTAR